MLKQERQVSIAERSQLIEGLSENESEEEVTSYFSPLYAHVSGVDNEQWVLLASRPRKHKVDRFERYGNEAEAKASQQANGLIPRPGHEKQPKWIGQPGTIDPRTLGKRRNYTYKIEIEAFSSTLSWLKPFERKPRNEPRRYAIPSNRLDEFNKRIIRITIKRR